jgi:hypothetical protein
LQNESPKKIYTAATKWSDRIEPQT